MFEKHILYFLIYIQAQELIAELKLLKENGKFITCYGRNMSNLDWFISTAMDESYLQKSGNIDIIGRSFPQIFMKNMFEKIGISPYVLKRENYKSFGDMFTEDKINEYTKKNYTSLGNDLHNQYLYSMKHKLNIDNEDAQFIVDNAPYTVKTGIQYKLINNTCHWNDYIYRLSELCYHDPMNPVSLICITLLEPLCSFNDRIVFRIDRSLLHL